MKKPTIGSWVRVTTDWSDAKASFGNNVPRTHTTVGQVVKPAEWENLNTIALRTSNKNFPIASIQMSRVVSLEYIDVSSSAASNTNDASNSEATVRTTEASKAPMAPQEFKVTGSKGDIYTVTRTGDTFTCTCTAGSFGRFCKHVKSIRDQITT